MKHTPTEVEKEAVLDAVFTPLEAKDLPQRRTELCQHFWSLPRHDGMQECLWCYATRYHT